MPSRFGSPRGSIPRILREAGEIADARMKSVQRYLDDFTAADDPKDQVGGGKKLARRDFVALLKQSPDFQQSIANRWAFASAKERETLLTVLREAFPQETGPAALQIPRSPIPQAETGTGLGGPPQGAGPVGAAPLPQPGAAPAPGPSAPAPPPPAMMPPPPAMPGGPVLGAPMPPGPPPVTLPPTGPALGQATAGVPGLATPGLPPPNMGPPGLPQLAPQAPMPPANLLPPQARRPALAAGMV